MAADQRKILEQLMGPELLSGVGSGKFRMMKFTDAKVCRNYLCGVCPHELFTNTKQDLGACHKIHSETLRAEYAEESKAKDFGYEMEYERTLMKFIEECEKRVETAYKKLEMTQEEIADTEAILDAIMKNENDALVLVTEIQTYASMGLMREALETFNDLLCIQKERESLEVRLRDLSTAPSSGHQKLQVCDVCSAYLSKLDSNIRLADHFSGKLHQGYARMRNQLLVLQGNKKKRAIPDTASQKRSRVMYDKR